MHLKKIKILKFLILILFYLTGFECTYFDFNKMVPLKNYLFKCTKKKKNNYRKELNDKSVESNGK